MLVKDEPIDIHTAHFKGETEEEVFLNVDQQIADLEQESQDNPPKGRDLTWQFGSNRNATIALAIFACMGGLLSGLDQSLISGANLYMPTDLHLTADQASFINSAMPLGAVFGSLILSPCNELFGRRWSIIIACVLYTIGAALEAGAISNGMMIAGRLVLGAGVGLEGGTVPVYVAECVRSEVRGRIVSLYQFNIALGEVLGYAVAAIFVNVDGNWRYILGSSLVFSTIMLCGMLILPESPRFLMHKKKPLESYRAWKNLRGFDDPTSKLEFLDMQITAEEERTTESLAEKKHAWLDFFRVARCRRALVYANMMIFLGQFTGVNAIMYYMSTLMHQIGFTDEKSVFMSLVGGGALLIGTIPACFYMDKRGRRFWANVMLPGFFIGLLFVGISYPPIFANGSTGLYLAGLILYMGFFGSYACLTWVVPSEVYPTYLRSYGMTTSSATLFLWSFVVTYNFTRMQDAMTKTGLALGFYGGIAVFGWFYQLFFMPETKGKTLEEIDLVFSKPTSQIVAENVKQLKQIGDDLMHFRFSNL